MMGKPIKECEYCGAVGHMPTFMNGETMCYACLATFPKTAHDMRKEIAKLRALHTTAPSTRDGWKERDAMRDELMEQCRLLGMSAEREAKHLAQITALEKERDALRSKIAEMGRQEPVAEWLPLDSGEDTRRD